MAKHKKGGLKLRQEGMRRPASKKLAKKTHSKAPWDDPLKEFERGGNRH
jgi:uncharacterized phage-associated protein